MKDFAHDKQTHANTLIYTDTGQIILSLCLCLRWKFAKGSRVQNSVHLKCLRRESDGAFSDKQLFGGPYWFRGRGRDQWKETDWDKEWHLRVEKADIFSITVTAAAIKQQRVLKHFSSAQEYWQQKLFSPPCDTQAELPVGSPGTADWCLWHIGTSIYTHLPLIPKQPGSRAGEGR